MRLILPDQKCSIEIRIKVVATFDEALDGFMLVRFNAIDHQARSSISGIEAFVEVVSGIKRTVFVDELALNAQSGVL